MRKSFLQMVGENLSGHVYGIDLYDPLQKKEVSQDMEASEEFDGVPSSMKALKEKNKRR